MLDKLIMGVVWATIFLLSITPLKLRVSFGRILGRLFALIPTRDTKITVRQLELFLKAKNPRRLLSAIYAYTGQVFMETVNLDQILSRSAKTINCENLNLLESLRRPGKGILALISHTGNWELMGAYVVQQGFPLVTTGREAQNKFLHKVLQYLRDRYRVVTLWRMDRSSIKQIVSLLKKNYVLAVIIDQDTKVRSVHVPFFGVQASTPSTAIEIAKKQGASIISAFMYQTGANRYCADFREINNSLTTEEIIAVYNNRLEEIIRKYPQQWVWYHKRWRTKLDGDRLSSRRYLKWLDNLKSGNA